MQKTGPNLIATLTPGMTQLTSSASTPAVQQPQPLAALTDSATPSPTGPPVALSRSRRKSIHIGRPRPRTIATNADTQARKPSAREPQTSETQPQQPASKPQFVRITLDETQTAILEPILNKHRDATTITGLLCVVSKSFRPFEGCVTIELQVLVANQRVIAALEKITRG
jgi:hypothetical protein